MLNKLVPNAAVTVNVLSTLVSTPDQTANCVVLVVFSARTDVAPVGETPYFTNKSPFARFTTYPVIVMPAVLPERLAVNPDAETKVSTFAPNLALNVNVAKLIAGVVNDKSQVKAYGLSIVIDPPLTVLLNIVWSVLAEFVNVNGVEFRIIIPVAPPKFVCAKTENGNSNKNSSFFIFN